MEKKRVGVIRSLQVLKEKTTRKKLDIVPFNFLIRRILTGGTFEIEEKIETAERSRIS